jgi:hypothetical protein
MRFKGKLVLTEQWSTHSVIFLLGLYVHLWHATTQLFTYYASSVLSYVVNDSGSNRNAVQLEICNRKLGSENMK